MNAPRTLIPGIFTNIISSSPATISNGFDHYITGLYLNHITTHYLKNYDFTKRMRRNLWETFAKMSLQLPDEEL
ncbi:MAG: hypothetical protein IIY51_00730 [Erysipelotrichaceae bacterium]|nr:hypothetical protein [Erysipelotrichaceae bacterium]MBQ2684689.1 hypothetical protein [Erysipelotrichaceae bacterium]